MPRDELIRAAVRALHAATEADKGLTLDNTVIGVVGEGERFHVLEGEAVAPFLLGLDAEPRPAHTVTQAEADMRMPVEGEEPTSAASLAPAGGAGAAAGGGGGGGGGGGSGGDA
jgi:hypothetical protein